MKTFHYSLFCIVLLLTSGAQAAMPPQYHAVYELHKFGLNAAQSNSSLKKNPDGSWSYESQTVTKGVISIFRKDRITERAQLKIDSGQIKPLSYEYIHKGSKKNRNRSIQFDWDNMSADSMVRGHHSNLPLQADTVDNFSLQLRLMQDLKTDKRPLNYHVIKKGKLAELGFQILGRETVETAAGDYEAVKLKRTRKDSKRTTIMWTAPSLHYLPVKIQHIEPDGSKFSLLLKSVSGDITQTVPTADDGQ